MSNLEIWLIILGGMVLTYVVSFYFQASFIEPPKKKKGKVAREK